MGAGVTSQTTATPTAHADRPVADSAGALLPPHVRRIALGAVALAMLFAVYLFVVRGPALLLDLAHTAASMFCL